MLSEKLRNLSRSHSQRVAGPGFKPMSTRLWSTGPLQDTKEALLSTEGKGSSQAKVYLFHFLLFKKENVGWHSCVGRILRRYASKCRFASESSRCQAWRAAPLQDVTEPAHCIHYHQETLSLGGPGLYKLSRAVIAVVMNITVWLRFCAACIICFANLSWADWISLSLFNISRFWNWKNKIFHSWEKRINLGNAPRWHPQTVHFLHWNKVRAVCALAVGTCSVTCTSQEKRQELGASFLERALTTREHRA